MDNGDRCCRRFLSGDESAFDEIMQNYRPGLTFFIDRIVHDPDAAEDIAVDVFAHILLHPHRYDGRASFKTYLYTLGRSRALDFLRHRRRAAAVSLEEAAELPADPGSDPEACLLADERRRIVHTALDRLSPERRMAVHLVYFAGLSYDETARVMKKTRKQVDNLLYRAKGELRSIIGEEGIRLL